jgi:hypothetical protein
MAVSEQTPYKEYTANGSANSFALEFDCENQDHLIVLVDDVEPVVGTWSLIGGAVVFGTPPINGKKITIQRNTPFSRTTDYQSYNNSFRPPAVNKDFDWIWLKLQELGVADWILGARIDALKNYVDRKDDELKAYLMEEIRKQGVALDQLDEYYNYLMQRLAQIAVDKGWDASFVVDGDKTQKEINRYIVQPFKPGRTYLLNERVQLANGDIVKSTAPNNVIDPNVDTIGWVKTNDASQIIDLSGLNQQQVNDLKVDKKDVLPATQTKDSFKNVYSTKLVNQWERIRAKTPCGRAYIWKNPKYSSDLAYRFSLGINQSGWSTAEWDFIADVDNFYRMRYGFVGAIREPSLKLDTTETSITPLGTNGNKYFSASTQLNATFKVNFTGVGFLMNHRCDEYGGLWEISVDGVVIKVISTHINNPENSNVQSSNITKLITNTLPSGAHEATFKFIGDDPLYPPTGGVSRGWFKIIEGTGTFPTAFIVTGGEMGMSPNGTILVSNNILEFAIGGTPTATSYPADWIPAHGSASGCIAIQKRTIFINNNAYDDNLAGISGEVEIKEFTMTQDYTAYNSNDNSKTYPLWDGELITKFNQKDGLHYIHNFKTRSEFLGSDGYTGMGSAQRRDSSGNILLKKLTCDNGFSLDISGSPPASQITHYTGNLTSAAWEGDRIALAMKVGNAEASSSIGQNTTDGRATVVTERPDRFCKLYFKPIGTNKIIPTGTEFSSIHYVWLATF